MEEKRIFEFTPKQLFWLKRYAEQAVLLERELGVPAELCVGMTLVETGRTPSSLAERCNNFHGLKPARKWDPVKRQYFFTQPHELFTTREVLAAAVVESMVKAGRTVKLIRTVPDGRLEIELQGEAFRKFATMTEGFRAWAQFLIAGTYMKPRYELFKQHKDYRRWLVDLGRPLPEITGKPSTPLTYYTGVGYPQAFDAHLAHPTVQQAIKEARDKK